ARSLRARSRPDRRGRHRRRGAGRHRAGRAPRRRPGLPPPVGRRAPQHPVGRLDGAGSPARPSRRAHGPHPPRLGRDHAAQSRAAGGRRALRDARGPLPGPHRPRPGPRPRHRHAHGDGAAQHRPQRVRGPTGPAARPPRRGLRRDARGRRRAHRARDLDARLHGRRSADRRSARHPVRLRPSLPSALHGAGARPLPPVLPPLAAARVPAGDRRRERDRRRRRRARGAPGAARGRFHAAAATGPARADPDRGARRGDRRGPRAERALGGRRGRRAHHLRRTGARRVRRARAGRAHGGRRDHAHVERRRPRGAHPRPRVAGDGLRARRRRRGAAL
ncbi:MAG: hypothetical protein AVDCRST_MAG38-2411, partial [uncultured Solirubrobacteraceae bacterium]